MATPASYLSREASPAGRASRSAPSIPAMSRSASWRRGCRAPKARTRSSSRWAAAPSARLCSRPPSPRGRGRRWPTAPGDCCWARTCRRRTAPRSPARTGIVIEPARPDFTTLLGNATLSISQAGYNTVIETLCCADRAVLVPFATERETEQADRAAGPGRARHGGGGAAGHAVGAKPGRRRRSRAAGPSLKSFPPCDVDGGPKTAALLHRLLVR